MRLRGWRLRSVIAGGERLSSVPPAAPVPAVTEAGLPRTLASPRAGGEGQGSHRRGEDTAGGRERLAAQWVASQGHSPFPLLRVKP